MDATLRVLLTGGTPELRASVRRVLLALDVVLAEDRVDVAVVLQSGDGINVPPVVGRGNEATPFLFVADHGSERLAVDAFRAGAVDYLRAPLTVEALGAGLRRVCSVVDTQIRNRAHPIPSIPRTHAIASGPPGGRPREAPLHVISRPVAAHDDAPRLVGDSVPMVELRASIARVAATPCNVLVTGETGTGKELVARLIHQSSRRSARPFATINCSALPESLFESELFGHQRGAFTGAHASAPGRLRAAHGGTVFLDEVGELSLAMQPKLLRALEQREVQPLGSHRHDSIDVRWIAATNRDLAAAVPAGRFRADLFYRLAVYTIVVPPLRERPGDVAVLARAFLFELSAAYGRPRLALSEASIAALTSYAWPGNVRELRNTVESAMLNSDGELIQPDALPPTIVGHAIGSGSRSWVERDRVIEALRAAGWNKSDAARRLHWSRMTLYRKLARHRIDVTGGRDTVTRDSSRV